MNQGQAWLLLIHQLPAKPAYVRVKIWRRLQALGAIALKGSVYALPSHEGAREDFEWLIREIEQAGGDALICEARIVDGLSDREVEALFSAARDADYANLVEDIRTASDRLATSEADEVKAQIVRFRKRLAQIVDIDFFPAEGQRRVEAQLAGLEARISPQQPAPPQALPSPSDFVGRTWVTREGIKVDRIACAWLIRRFIDPEATLKFVPATGYAVAPGELRFDMFEAEFTHEGDLCSFEVLIERMGLRDRGLREIGEIVHDIDLKDSKFGREETAGIAHLLDGICRSQPLDDLRLERGSALFDDLLAYFQKS